MKLLTLANIVANELCNLIKDKNNPWRKRNESTWHQDHPLTNRFGFDKHSLQGKGLHTFYRHNSFSNIISELSILTLNLSSHHKLFILSIWEVKKDL